MEPASISVLLAHFHDYKQHIYLKIFAETLSDELKHNSRATQRADTDV